MTHAFNPISCKLWCKIWKLMFFKGIQFYMVNLKLMFNINIKFNILTISFKAPLTHNASL